MEIKFVKLYDDVHTPTKRSEDAGYDIYPHFEEDFIVINSHETKMIPTGIKTAFDGNYVCILKERGSTGMKGIGQRAGVIDSGYRGEWIVPITNHSEKTLFITKLDECETFKKYTGFKKNEIGNLTYELFAMSGFLGKTENNFIFYPYDKAITQAVFLPIMSGKWNEIGEDEFNTLDSERGSGKLGSSGK